MGTIIALIIGGMLGYIMDLSYNILKETLEKQNKSVVDMLVILGCSLHIYLYMMVILGLFVIFTAVKLG